MAKTIRRFVLLVMESALLALAFLPTPPAQAQGSENRLFMPVVQRHSAPPPAPGYIANPGFEYGYYGWAFSGGVTIQRTNKHNGTWAASLGGAGLRSTAIQQTITVPQGSPILEWWHLSESEEEPTELEGGVLVCEIFRDGVEVIINGIIEAEFPLCRTTDTEVWARQTLPLSDYAGQTVSLRVEFNSDLDLTSEYYVDDFAVK